MNRIEIKDFSIKIDKDKVLKTLGCFEGSSVYETVSSYFDELEETVMDLSVPACSFRNGGYESILHTYGR